MAAARHNLSRRAVLGAGVGACVVPPAPASLAALTDPADPLAPQWSRALAAYRCSAARLAAFRRGLDVLPPERRAYPDCEPLDEHFNDLECARLAALRSLLRAPAPGLAALNLKIGLVVDNQAWELTDAELCLAALRADARRLCHG